jgi:hypothetical protein
MAAKKRSKKKVTVEIDVEVLEKLIEAASALSDLASGIAWASDDPAARSLKKKAKRPRR